MSKPEQTKKSKHDDGYFDDCPICRAMKKIGYKMKRYDDGAGNDGIWEEGFSAAKIKPKDLEELKRVFRKAKDEGAVVGGEWLEGEGRHNDHPFR